MKLNIFATECRLRCPSRRICLQTILNHAEILTDVLKNNTKKRANNYLINLKDGYLNEMCYLT